MASALRYELPDPAYEAYTWRLIGSDSLAIPPISWDGGSFLQGRVAPDDVPLAVLIHGVRYVRADAPGGRPFGEGTMPASVHDLTAWREIWPPQIEALARQIESFDPASVPAGEWASTLDAQDREMSRVFTGVHQASVTNGHNAVEALTLAYVAKFGEESRPETLALLQGFPNLSLERAAALWDLSRIALADDAVKEAVETGGDLPENDAGRRFRGLFGETLERYGYTNNIGGLHRATWREDHSIVLGMVRTYMRLPEERGPRATAALQAENRRGLEAKVMDAGDADLATKLTLAQQFLPNLEDHNLICDQRIGALRRARWLTTGRYLMGRGLGAPDDVFYYRRPELIDTLEGGPLLATKVLDERRELMQAVSRYPPPPILGKPRETEAPSVPLEAGTRQIIRGIPASAGAYTGRARIIETLEDAGRLEPGDVLVARMTSPPWTPLFASIGALVVNTGGALSHGAVVAREFGIPAVLGTVVATTRIPDGATVTVDGTDGVVIIED
jgi:pyruvate,water dikinase